jgi:hypothetical protein
MNRALRINAYPGNELNHCVDDVSDVANFLVSHCDFQEEEILLLTDKRATTNAIAAHLNWLLTGVNEGDRVVFHYSGHGARFPIRNEAGNVTRVDEYIAQSILTGRRNTPFATNGSKTFLPSFETWRKICGCPIIKSSPFRCQQTSHGGGRQKPGWEQGCTRLNT